MTVKDAMLNQYFMTYYYLFPFLLSFFGIAGVLTLIVEVLFHG